MGSSQRRLFAGGLGTGPRRTGQEWGWALSGAVAGDAGGCVMGSRAGARLSRGDPLGRKDGLLLVFLV